MAPTLFGMSANFKAAESDKHTCEPLQKEIAKRSVMINEIAKI